MPQLLQKPTLREQIDYILAERLIQQKWNSLMDAGTIPADNRQQAEREIELLTSIEENLTSLKTLEDSDLTVADFIVSFRRFIEKVWLMRHSQTDPKPSAAQRESYEIDVDSDLAVLMPGNNYYPEPISEKRVSYEELGVAAIAKPNQSQLEKILGQEGEDYQLSN